ncbi:MAG TPA: transposase [Acidimicrobiales bacterium]|nr:transposase [Acidimicrobiales bacterium]
MVRTSDRSIMEVARSLGINDSTLHNWLKADRDAKDRAGDPGAVSETERAELARLRKENLELRTEKEILRKAAAYFARETMR